MQLEQRTIPDLMHEWARWASQGGAAASLGYRPYSSEATIRSLALAESPRNPTHPKAPRPLTANGKQTRSFRGDRLRVDPVPERVDRCIAEMRVLYPEAFLVLVAEYLGMVPVFEAEAWRPRWRGRRWDRRLHALQARPNAGWRWRFRPRRTGEPAHTYQERMATTLGLGDRKRYREWLDRAQILLYGILMIGDL